MNFSFCKTPDERDTAAAFWLQIIEIILTTFCLGRDKEYRHEFLKDILVLLAKEVTARLREIK
jgi:hypothetical protein